MVNLDKCIGFWVYMGVLFVVWVDFSLFVQGTPRGIACPKVIRVWWL